MALAQRHAGVTHSVKQGYQVKTKRVEKRIEPSLLQLVVKSLRANAREMREFIVDELVYETMDTLRVLRYIKYQLGFRPRRRNEMVVAEREPNYSPANLYPEPVRILAER